MRRVTWQEGLRGIRVGEASHPGPETADLDTLPPSSQSIPYASTQLVEAAAEATGVEPAKEFDMEHAADLFMGDDTPVPETPAMMSLPIIPPDVDMPPSSFQHEVAAESLQHEAVPSSQHQVLETPSLPARPRRTLTLVGVNACGCPRAADGWHSASCELGRAAIEAAAAALQGPQAEEPAEEPAQEEQTGWIPPRTWRQLEAVDLAAELHKPVRTVGEPPRWFRGSLCRAFHIALRQWEKTPNVSTWKLIVLLPRMLLQPTGELGEAGKEIFQARMRKFLRGDWQDLLDEAAASTAEVQKAQRGSDCRKPLEAGAQRHLAQAEAKIRMREVSRARVLLSSQGLAPGDATTLAELKNIDLRPAELSEELLADAMNFLSLRRSIWTPTKS